MQPFSTEARFLSDEARALLTRLDRVTPFSLSMPTVAAAAVSPSALRSIDRHLAGERRRLRKRVEAFLRSLQGTEARAASPAEQQRRFTLLRLQFNAALDQVDIFADVLTQRGEHNLGIWLAGLDAAAADALALPVRSFDAPPVVTYLDRGHGAAIRRARTRLPGGASNPVTIIRVPRERMVGSGIASSLVHEVGHQAAALLDLVNSLRAALRRRAQGAAGELWHLWLRWISEIVADFWALAKLGVAATLGLMGVVSLPRAFVFRVNLDDPHPFPWIRVKLSCAFGQALYADPQWQRLAGIWESLYPTAGLSPSKKRLIQHLEETAQPLVQLLVQHRPTALRGRTLAEVMPLYERRPAHLRALFQAWRKQPRRMCRAAPTLVLAVLGQARADQVLSPERESRLVAALLKRWATRGALGTDTVCRLLTKAA